MKEPVKKAIVTLEVEGEQVGQYDNFILVSTNDEGVIQCARVEGLNIEGLAMLLAATAALMEEVMGNATQQVSDNGLKDRMGKN